MNFSADFFLDEERCGFFVQQEMKRAWAAQIELLSEINDLCANHQLNWYAAWGTLLGAVRHKGFIPWDDDIDIWMCRRDYDLLIDLITIGELPKGLTALHPSLKIPFAQPFLRICNGDGIVLNAEHLRKYHDCPYFVGIDIFPLDNVCETNEKELSDEILDIIYAIIKMSGDGIIVEENAQVQNMIQQIEQMLQVKLDQTRYTKNELWLLCDKIYSLYKNENCRQLAEIWLYHMDLSVIFEKQWFDETTFLDFENIKVPVPKEYIKILEMCFGDWEIPVMGTSFHNTYPFYKDQKEYLTNMIHARGFSGTLEEFCQKMSAGEVCI